MPITPIVILQSLLLLDDFVYDQLGCLLFINALAPPSETPKLDIMIFLYRILVPRLDSKGVCYSSRNVASKALASSVDKWHEFP
jgi:hypothetical protein